MSHTAFTVAWVLWLLAFGVVEGLVFLAWLAFHLLVDGPGPL